MKAFVIPCLAVALAGGCAGFTPQPISPAAAVAEYDARSLDNPELRVFIQKNIQRELGAWPLPQWDIELLTLAAFFYHPDLDVARAKWQAAQAGVTSAGMHPVPSITLGAQRNVDAPSSVSPWTLGWNFDIPIETAGKRGYRIEQARHMSDAAKLAIASTAWQIRNRVRSSAVELHFAQQMQAQLLQEHTLQQNNVALLEHRLRLGLASQPDLTQAHIAAHRTALSLGDAAKTMVEARAKLASALGVTSAAIDHLAWSPDLFDQVPVLQWDGVRQQALLNRTDVLGALAEYAASQSALQLEIAKQYPDISLGPGYSWDAGERKWSLGLSMPLPLFGRNQGAIAEAKARRIQALANFQSIQAKAIGEIDTALASYHPIRDKLDAANALLADQNRQSRHALAAFQAGQIDKLEWVGAQLELSQLALARLDALAKTQQALGGLEEVVQRPLLAPAFVPASLLENPRPIKESPIKENIR